MFVPADGNGRLATGSCCAARSRYKHLALVLSLLASLADKVGPDLAEAIATAPQIKESDIRAQRIRIAQLKTRLLGIKEPLALDLLSVVDHLVRRSTSVNTTCPGTGIAPRTAGCAPRPTHRKARAACSYREPPARTSPAVVTAALAISTPAWAIPRTAMAVSSAVLVVCASSTEA
jgi:hypothetical protein